MKTIIKSASEHPTTFLTFIVVVVCAFRFLLDGLTVSFMGHNISFGHIDYLAYTSILTPVLTAHGYLRGIDKKRDTNI